ncbi:GLPGLI family protein [uncultured Lutibacter sp.]|uniref:GLPGLI family protein n=1 Tax=uncultured Lutibacter sp. TaxID=437739 RepID=UPI00262C4C17|nr:GLPGLI family protein [uncultured Lutibacter sp.]
MKNLILIIFYLFTTFLNAQNSIEGSVVYTISLNTANKKEISETKKNEQAIQIIKKARDVVGFLNFNEIESLFQVDKPMGNDVEKEINLTRIFAGKDNVFYYSIATKERLLQKDFMGELFLISKEPIEWKITQESKQIGDYTCFKAIKKDSIATNKKTIAWFTPQIPISLGPREFNGLPGLILDVNYSELRFKATKIEINQKNMGKIKKPTKGKKITEAEYKEITSEAGKNIFEKN